MSTAVSRAARELAEKAAIAIRKRYDVGVERRGIFNHVLNNSGIEEVIAQAVDSALADLLLIAEHTLCTHEDGGCIGEKSKEKLKSALEPWKAEQITQKPENK